MDYSVKFFKKNKLYVLLILVFLIFYSMNSILLYYFERGNNPDCQNIFEAFWLNTVYILSGFENYGPKTYVGKILSLLSFLFGIFLIAVITGKMASIFVIKSRKEFIMTNTNNFIVICNWNIGGEKIVEEIHSPDAEPETEILIISDNEINEIQLRQKKAFRKVYFIKSDPTLHDVLLNQKVDQARSVIILANNGSPDPDANSALIALAITKIASNTKKPRIVAESINHRKIEHLKDAGVDEIICASDYEYGILAQCALYGKLSEVYRQILNYSEDTCEFYIIDSENLPEILIGKSFADASKIIIEKRTENPIILIGIVRNDQVLINPKDIPNQDNTVNSSIIQRGDKLIVLAYTYPTLDFIKG